MKAKRAEHGTQGGTISCWEDTLERKNDEWRVRIIPDDQLSVKYVLYT